LANEEAGTPPADKPKTVAFPYKTLDLAVKDGFKKIGGPDQAFRFLAKGFKEVQWRKRANANTKAREAEEDKSGTP
jgi:hypothetical protein